jgi:hypothetical protein
VFEKIRCHFRFVERVADTNRLNAAKKNSPERLDRTGVDAQNFLNEWDPGHSLNKRHHFNACAQDGLAPTNEANIVLLRRGEFRSAMRRTNRAVLAAELVLLLLFSCCRRVHPQQ